MLEPKDAQELLILLRRAQNLLTFNEAASAVNLKNKLLIIAGGQEPKKPTAPKKPKTKPKAKTK